MADVLGKGEKAMGSQSGLKAPGTLSGLNSNRPVLDNRWGSKLASGKQSSSLKGGKK
mgnify:CR=1 FL=1